MIATLGGKFGHSGHQRPPAATVHVDREVINDSPRVPLVPTSEAARELGISERTLRRWAKDGYLEPDLVMRGGHYRWDVARVRRELQERYRQQREEERRG